MCEHGHVGSYDEFWDYLTEIEPIRLREPLAETLGAIRRQGAPIEYTFVEVVKLAGHACPTTAAAYEGCRAALNRLYPDQTPVRGFVAATCGMLAIAGVTSLTGHNLLIGSFGASAVLLYGTPDSPLAQPRNVLDGHLLSALVGCAAAVFLGTGPLALAAAVGLAIVVMYITHTTHPPGGATAFIGVHDHAGWLFPLLPVTVGAVILVVIAVFANNIVNHRQYPKH